MRREQDREQGGFDRQLLKDMVRAYDPLTYQIVQNLSDEVQADFYDRLGRAYGAALDRAVLYGTEQERQARTRALLRGNMAANKPWAPANE